MQIKQWLEDHPYKAGAVVIGLVVLIFLVLRSRGSSDQTVAVQPAGLDPSIANSQIAAATQQYVAQTNAGIQTATIAAQLQALILQTQTDSHVADLAASVQNNQTSSAQAVQLAAIQAQRDIATSGTSASQAVQLAGLSTQQAISIDNNRTQTTIANTAAQTTTQVATLTAHSTDLATTTAATTEQHLIDTIATLLTPRTVVAPTQPVVEPPTPVQQYRDATLSERVSDAISSRPDVVSSFYDNIDPGTGRLGGESWTDWTGNVKNFGRADLNNYVADWVSTFNFETGKQIPVTAGARAA